MLINQSIVVGEYGFFGYIPEMLRVHFCDKWMKTSPNAKKYKIKGGYCYNEADFIDYLNEYAFPEEKSVFVKNLGWTDLGRNLPAEYKDHPYFNF